MELKEEADARIETLIREIIRLLVNEPEEVHAKLHPTEAGALLEVRVAPADMVKVIGPDGRTERSLRVILRAASIRTEDEYCLEIRQ